MGGGIVKAPKPTTGYIVVCPDWDPKTEPSSLWNQVSRRSAEDSAEHAKFLGSTRTVIVEVRTEFRIVEPAPLAADKIEEEASA